MDNSSTICAISTPPGVGGIAVARVSGPDAFHIVQQIWKGKNIADMKSHTAHLGTILDNENNPLDQALITIFRAPNSFTGQDTVEISVHGSTYIQQTLIQSLVAAGATPAGPGEFTRRAFTAGHFDLTQAEAIADLIAASDKAAHRIAIRQMRGQISSHLNDLRQQLIDLAALFELELDFSEEDVTFASRDKLRKTATELHRHLTDLTDTFATGNAIKNGIPTAIIGPTNAGKSSLLNTLLQDDRAIVSDINGTTRDIIEDTLNIGGATLRLMDTAGLRDTDDDIERLGISRSTRAAAHAAITLLVIDPNDTRLTPSQTLSDIRPHINPHSQLIILLNKSDITPTDTIAQAIATLSIQSDSPSKISETLSNNLNTQAHSISEQAHALTKSVDTRVNPEDTNLSSPIIIPISTRTQQGIPQLKQHLTDIIKALTTQPQNAQDIIITNARHAQALSQAADSIARVIQGIDENIPTDLIAQDLRQTIHHISQITGQITTTQILSTIFSRFCIGK